MKVTVLCVCLLAVATVVVASEPPRLPATPAAVNDLVFARPFTLAEGYRYDWSQERPMVTSGILVVLRVDRELVVPRNSAEPVLYAGEHTVQRLNHGYQSGFVIGIIPADIDLTQAPIWFGHPGLPERATAQSIKSEKALAAEAKIVPFSVRKVDRVTRDRLQVPDLSTLLRDYVADLVLRYSPQEKDLARKWRLPVAKADEGQR